MGDSTSVKAGSRTAAAPGSDPGPLIADAEPGGLPNLIVIGAQKCGTRAFHYYLSLHPEISMSKPKELNFFIEERNWPRGIDWYRGHFDPRARVRGEASPNYTAYPFIGGVPERMASVIPETAKLIYMVRDPLERIAAHWVHTYALRHEKGTLAETLAYPDTSYVARSMYWMQLERFLRHYPREQVLVIEQSELLDRRLETLRRVFEFLGVDPEFTDSRFEQHIHETSRKVRLTRLTMRLKQPGESRDWRLRLADLLLRLEKRLPRRAIERPEVPAIAGALSPETLAELRADAERLRDFTGREFADWTLWEA